MIDDCTHAILNQAKFDAWANTYNDKRYDRFRRMHERLLLGLDLREGMSFLDIGCGTGWAVRRAVGLIGSGSKAFGVDLAAKMIDKARSNASGVQNIEFLQANAEELPFLGCSFDSIICTMPSITTSIR